MQIFVAGAKQGLDVRTDLNALLHSVAGRFPSCAPGAHCLTVQTITCTRTLFARHLDVSAHPKATRRDCFLVSAKLFSLEMKPAGVLAPKVQATTIGDRVPPCSEGVNGGSTSYAEQSYPFDPPGVVAIK